MKSTMSLHWKSVVSKIHPPLPMSPRESARLLTLLNSSFKHQLDRQHPAGLPNSEHHTDSHLHTILANPLFERRSESRGMRSKDQAFGRVQDLVKRPMDVFREQVSAGTATIQLAGLCLQAQYNSCLASPDSTLASAMRASGAGMTVVEWLWSSGTEKRCHFLEFQESLGPLVLFLIAEGRHDRVLQWLRRLYAEPINDGPPETYRRYARLLLDFIKAEISLGQGLESATALFIQVASDAKDGKTRFDGINEALSYVAYYLTIILRDVPKTAELQASTLEPLINMSKSFTATKRGSCVAALQGVYLAKNPSTEAALQYFKGLSPNRMAALKSKQRPHIIFLGLKTAELCLNHGRQAEARLVMAFLQSNFKNEMGPRTLSDNYQMTEGGADEAQDHSLRLLDSLAIA